jgi:hypothetical protein
MRVSVKKIFERYTFQKRRPETVHYMFPLVAVALGLLGAALTSGSGSYLTLTATPQTLSPGQAVEISVDAFADTPVNAVDVLISLPTDTLEISSVDTGESVITLWTDDPKIENGKVALRGGVYRKGFVGRHHLATLKGKALQNGTAEVLVRNMTFLAGDGKGSSVQLQNSTEKIVLNVGGSQQGVHQRVGGIPV